jgi:putative transposase
MKNQKQNEPILERITALKAQHPFWGYRRIWAYLRYREGLDVNKKRIYRLMKENNLLVSMNTKLKASRTPLKAKPRPNKPNQIWGIDMTKIMVAHWGWLYLHIVLDWYTKKIVGYNLSWRSKTGDWLDALEKSLQHQFPDGIRDSHQQTLMLVSDNGSQPTSVRFMAACNVLGIRQIFASYNNPKGNADTERVIRTIKEDLIWPRDFETPFELQEALDDWVTDYNTDYPHSSLSYKTPFEFERMHYEKLSNFLVA